MGHFISFTGWIKMCGRWPDSPGTRGGWLRPILPILPILFILLILLLALWARWPGMGKSAWEDEVHSFIESRPGAATPIYEMTGSAPAAYWTSFRVFRVCDMFAHTGRLTLVRLPILLLSLAGVWAGWRMGRVWRNRFAGFVLALLLALWPFRAEWDTQVRYYGVLLALAPMMLLAWEDYRRRPDWRRFLVGVILTLFAALTHILAIVLIAVPWIYLGWTMLRMLRCVWRIFVRRRGNNRTTDYDYEHEHEHENEHEHRRRLSACLKRNHRPVTSFLPLVLQGGLLLWITLCALQFNRGAEWSAETVARLVHPHKIVAPPPDVSVALATLRRAALADMGITAGGRAVRARRALEALDEPGHATHIPPPGEILSYLGRGVAEMFVALSPAPLLGLEGNREPVFRGLVLADGHENGPRYRLLNALLLVGVLVGSVVLARVSPPLLVSLWLIIISTSVLLHYNTSNHFLAARYYALPGLGGLIFCAVALGALPGVVSRYFRHNSRRAAPVRRGVMVMTAVLLIAFFIPFTRAGARYTYQDWQGLLRECAGQYPGGTLYAGIGAKNVDFYQRLATYQDDRADGRDYWRSPRRSGTLDAFAVKGLLDWSILENLNNHEGLCLIRYSHWSTDYFPFVDGQSILSPLEPADRLGVVARCGALGHRVYVTRGQTSLPLMPRLREGAANDSRGERRYTLDCYFEVPGEYEFAVGVDPAGQAPALLVDGQPVPMERRFLRRSLESANRQSALARSARKKTIKDENEPDAGEPLPLDLSADWRAGADRDPPLLLYPPSEMVARLRAPDAPLAPLRLTLIYPGPIKPVVPRQSAQDSAKRRVEEDAGDNGLTPVAQWRLQGRDWFPVTDSYEAGAPRAWSDATGIHFGVPLRITRPSEQEIVPRLYLADTQTTRTLAECDGHTLPALRGLRQGDTVWLGPLTLPADQARAWLDRPLVLGIMPLRANPSSDNQLQRDRLINQQRLYGPLGIYLVSYARLAERNGKMDADFSEKPDILYDAVRPAQP